MSWEGTSFPEITGDWEHSTYCTPERWIDDEWMFQDVEALECADPPAGDRDSYTRLIGEFDGAQTFFIEWRIFADGDRSEIPWGAPAVLTAWTFGPVFFGFTMSRDQVKFVQDDFVVILFVDIEPGVHTHRLEVYGDELYPGYIDSEIAHQDGDVDFHDLGLMQLAFTGS